jgi:hypothetical protein
MTVIRTDLVLSQSAFSHVIDVPFEKIDIAKWQSSSGDHNRRETPLFAESIARAERANAA